MAKAHSTPAAPARKPEKPATSFLHPSEPFPLFAHARGYWAKKVRGRMVYFGRWDDPEGAEQACRQLAASVSFSAASAHRWSQRAWALQVH